MCVSVFSCACDHVFTHFVTVIVRLGTGVMECKCTCVNEISWELLGSIFGLCVIPGFFTCLYQTFFDFAGNNIERKM